MSSTRKGVSGSRQIHYLVLTRHGLSEGNVAQKMIRNGQAHKLPEEFFKTPNRELRLTSIGVAQCKPTGEYLASQYPDRFSLIVTADFIRSTETMLHTVAAAGWPGVELATETLYGERIWGPMPTDRDAVLQEMEMRRRDPMNWCTPGGEMLVSTRVRARILLDRAKREFAGNSMLVFTHGEFIEAVLAEVYHLDTESFIEFRNSELGDIDNCQVIELSSINPGSGLCEGELHWIRSSCPQKGEFGFWQPILRKKYRWEALNRRVLSYRRFLE